MTPLKRHRFITFLLLFACLSLSLSTGAQRRKRNSASGNDSLKVDSALVDTLSIDTVAPKKKQPLDAPVIYEANDSIVFTEGGYAHLYGDGKVNYEKIELTSAVITMNMDSSTVYARGVPDSVGVEKGTPIFKDGETPYESKIMRYNFKSKKGFINNIVTQQGEGYVTSEESKKGSNDEGGASSDPSLTVYEKVLRDIADLQSKITDPTKLFIINFMNILYFLNLKYLKRF